MRDGSRIFLVEVQALVSPSRYGTPQRVVQGVDGKRVALLAAILEKRAGLDLAGCDIFLKVAGGGRADDPAADLAIIVALASSLREVPVPADTLVLGEVGLTGEVRGAADQADRLREAAHHGFRRAIVAQPPRRARPSAKGLEAVPVASVEEAVALLPAAPGRSRRRVASRRLRPGRGARHDRSRTPAAPPPRRPGRRSQQPRARRGDSTAPKQFRYAGRRMLFLIPVQELLALPEVASLTVAVPDPWRAVAEMVLDEAGLGGRCTWPRRDTIAPPPPGTPCRSWPRR